MTPAKLAAMADDGEKRDDKRWEWMGKHIASAFKIKDEGMILRLPAAEDSKCVELAPACACRDPVAR